MGHYIIALDVSCECLKVDNHRYENPKTPKWPIKTKYRPQIAHVVNDTVVLENITKDFVQKL